MKNRKLKSAFTPTPIYIVAAKLEKTFKTTSAGFRNAQSKCKLVWGFTLVELIICLVIVGIVLTAAAIAFDACIANYEANKNMSDSVIKANQVLSRITIDLRCSTAVNPSEANSQCSMVTAEGNDITYLFNQSEGKLYLVENKIPPSSHILCENIGSARFDKTTANDVNGAEYVKSVQIMLKIGSGNSARNACAAVAIRRNL
jgi:prepilin-type N-terminal cleavage/methylation domain-containing protein